MTAALLPPLPRLVLGTMTFGAPVTKETAAQMLRVCSDTGITMLDTANVYAGGTAEAMLGELLAGRRQEFWLASKVGMPSPDAGDAAPLSRRAIRSCLDASLRRLGTDYLDVYYLHQPDRDTPAQETLAAMDEQVRAGKVRYLGVSNYAAWQISELTCVAERAGYPAPVVSQPLYNLVARRIEAEYAEYAARAGLANVVYNPLGGGLLTGKHHFGQAESAGRFGEQGLGPMYRQRYWSKPLFDAVAALQDAAAASGWTLTEAALRWLLSRDCVTSVLLGASSLEHLTANIAACQGPGPDAALCARFDDIWRELDGPAPAYNR
jgi:aryl-alcohol dehydrogenase-like predicted oxidoreductase